MERRSDIDRRQQEVEISVDRRTLIRRFWKN